MFALSPSGLDAMPGEDAFGGTTPAGERLNGGSSSERANRGDFELAPVNSAHPHSAIVPTRPLSLLALSTRPRPLQSRNNRQDVRSGTIPSLTTLEYTVRCWNLLRTSWAGPQGRIRRRGLEPGSESFWSFLVSPLPAIMAPQPLRTFGAVQLSPRSCPVRPTKPKSKANRT